ncbi:peptidoglycan hydrolase [Saccharopolyspora erythraea]|uniref:glycosyl hydrolase family 18 protein n=1 Tax=Saccharopolyspora erythraea TaxID=1836 RepID=UPI001BA9435B|nr:glycosyl hydrolase family 18 protein [Saccharopolyspora erythraea]QUH02671.1 peptidoglycan hydrolase [Saccharopolyspora erythraea]
MANNTTRPRRKSVAAQPVAALRRRAGSVWFLALIGCAMVLAAVMAVPRPAPVVPSGTVVVASLPFWNLGNGTATVVQNRTAVNEVSPWMYGLGDDGRLTIQYSPAQATEVAGHLQRLREAQIPIVPSLANITEGNWSYEPVARMLHDPDLMRRHVFEIVELVKRENYAGIDIDYENLRAGDREQFTRFVTDLGRALHAEGKTLSVAVFAKTSDAGYDERNVAQDYVAIGQVADQVRLMGYDFHWGTSRPGPVAPVGWIRDVLSYATSVVPKERIVLGVPLYGYDWVDGQGTSVTWLQAFRLATEHKVPTFYDARTQSPWFAYTDAQGRRHEVWFENTASSKAKFEAARGAGIRGVYLWMYGYEDTGTWPELRASLPVTKSRGRNG